MKYLLGEATPGEQEQVRQWLEADDANLVSFEQLRTIWNDSRQLASAGAVDENKAWRKFQKRVHASRAHRGIPSWLRIAASVIIVTGIGLLAYLGFNNNTTEIAVAALQSVVKDTLPDGSMVTINKGSSISYPSAFRGRTRPVSLKGEAFFTVAPDKKKPFIISVNDVQIEVVGTSFNVKNIDGATQVVVETGVVKVTGRGTGIELRAGEEVMIGGKDSVLTKERVKDQLYRYYRTKEFVCKDTPLWKLVAVINEAYGSHVVIGNDALKDVTLTTTFNNESLDQVLNVISITFDIEVVKQEDTIILQ